MPATAITLADIRSADWSLKLDSADQPGSGIGKVAQGIDDVDQCIAIILTTPKGTDALRPSFGTDIWRYIDAPISQAAPAIVREVTQAILQWEPRVKVLAVRSAPALSMTAQPGSHVMVTVSWQLNLDSRSGPTGSTSVRIATSLTH